MVRGQGGEGKTALAAEFARWMVRSHQVRRAAFVSVEGMEKNIAERCWTRWAAAGGARLSRRGRLPSDVEKAIQKIERALREQATLLVLDNMESILLPQFVAAETPEALSEEARRGACRRSWCCASGC